MEQWNIIKNYPDYQISDKGNVRSRRRRLTLIKKKTGYLCVTLSRKGKQKQFLVHKLVAEHFLDKNGKPHINHLDEDKTNNNVDNLERCTRSENQRHSFAKRVIQTDLFGNLIKVFEALVDVDLDGFDHRHVLKCCKGLRKTHKNYIWNYE